MEEGKSHFCGHCGSPLEGGAAFCGKCGTKVESVGVGGVTPKQYTGTLMQQTQQPVLPGPQMSTKKKNKTKYFVISGAVLALAVGIAFLVPLLIGVMTPKTRVMMVYMIGSNLESDNAAASLDIMEMEEAGFNTEDTRVIIYAGGARRWQLPEMDYGENAILEVTPNGVNKVKSYEQKSMVDPDTLTDFVDYVYENYDANLYDLVFWDHAGGPMLGFGDDELYETDPMSLNDLSGALAKTKLVQSGKKFEFVGFDACIMGGIEIAMALKDYSNYMIGSEESEPNEGWNYEFLAEVTRNKTSEEVIKRVVEDYADFYGDEYAYEIDISLSAIDLSKIEQLAESAGDLFEKINTAVTAETFSKYSRALTRKQVYGYNGRDSESVDLVDLKDLISGVADIHPDEVAKVEHDIEAAVVYSESNIEYTNGLSVYFPTKNKQAARLLVAAYKDVSFSDKYYDFLKKYTTLVGGKRMVEKDNYDDLGTTVSDSSISVELPTDLAENYQDASIVVYRKINDNDVPGDWYIPVYQSSEVNLNDNVLKATTNNLQFVLKVNNADGTESYKFVTLVEKERNGDYAEYTTFGVLAVSDDESTLGFETKAYELTLRVDKDNNVSIREIREHNSDSSVLSKRVFSLDEILWIDFITPSMNLNNEISGTDYGTEVSLKDGDTMEFELVDLGSKFDDMCGNVWCISSDEVYYRFKVYDTQGVLHWLDMTKVNI